MEAALRQALAEAMPEVLGPEVELDPHGPLVPADRHLELARLLAGELGFTLYVALTATHFPGADDRPEAWEVATVLRRPGPGTTTFRWRVRLEGEPRIDSLYPVFPAADWQEREQYDLVGVVFEGHPDPRRLMLPEDWEGHPLRRDYPIDKPHPPWR